MPMKIYVRNLPAGRFICVIIVALSLSLTALTVQAEKNELSTDKVAIVNGSVISGEEFNRELNQVKQRIPQQGIEITSNCCFRRAGIMELKLKKRLSILR